MASKEQVVIAFNAVGAMYPWASMTDATLAIWATILADVDGAALQAATVAYLSGTERNPPTAGILRNLALDIAAGPEDDWEAGWQAAMRHMTECRGIGAGQCAHNQAEIFDAPTYAAVSTIGWPVLCFTLLDNMPTVRAQFRDLYRAAAKRQRDAARTPPAVQAIMDTARPRIEPPAARISVPDTQEATPQGIRGVPGDIDKLLDAGGRPRRAELDAIIRRVAAQRGGVL